MIEAPSTAKPATVVGPRTAIEAEDFPFEHLSAIAEVESWRKEIHRPIYHLHKWWAQRLGSVFRAVLVGTFSPASTDVTKAFYGRTRLSGTVFDPFMGSGTTIGEALKLGQRPIGRDINPVAYLTVRTALAAHDRSRVMAEFASIESDVAARIKSYYQSVDSLGRAVDVLYYFWVKVVACPRCEADVDLFSSYIFAKNAYVNRHPLVRVVCPSCGAIAGIQYGQRDYTCERCANSFDPMKGPAHGVTATCGGCGHDFSIVGAVRRSGHPPRHRLYAKLIVGPDGTKSYQQAGPNDCSLYDTASQELKARTNPFPLVRLADGHNTRQVLNYCYEYWHQMFNDRQLLCLSLLGERIAAIQDLAMRELFTVLLSGVLEFNNMFASYKGEGTGAVRHMFSHHILKPERTPLEANPWGTPKSSGSFSTLFRSRILKAMDYADDPHEVTSAGRPDKKVYGLSLRIGHEAASSYEAFVRDGFDLYLSCGDSAATDLPDQSVDAVVTDPPFFDNVHYSELADFFYVWQRHMLGASGSLRPETTRTTTEVQSTDAHVFAERLSAVFRECNRVLKDDGLLVFTYHHSRSDGWRAMLEAVIRSGFKIVATHPIKSEMSVASPKSQAAEPIDLDVIVVCRKTDKRDSGEVMVPGAFSDAFIAGRRQVRRFASAGRHLGLGDIRVIVAAQAAKALSGTADLEVAINAMNSMSSEVEALAARLFLEQTSVEAISESLPLFDTLSSL